MKKLFSALLVLCLLLCACGEKKPETAPHTTPGEETVFPETVWSDEAVIIENTSESIFEKPVVSVLNTNLDVQNYLNTYGTLVDLSPLNLTEKYDDAFFADSCLVVFLLDTPGKACVPCVDKVDAMGIMTDINVTVQTGEPDEISATWLIMVETEKSVADSDVYIYVY